MHRFTLPLFFAASALHAAEVDPSAAVYDKLLGALTQAVVALEKIDDVADAEPAVAEIQESIRVQNELLEEDDTALWQYIENTKDRKQALIDILERLALQFARLEKTNYFDNAELKALLADQIEENAEAAKAKRAKVHAVDHDED